ncbi:hypothetical protein [Acinetobacter johnsonii]|uniref:hypothetical protein n=1 Tax=Acinetobacter johnsonii TaxID=40214 RepID=UPI001F1E45F1|nr:hypothetical protein [Acinetobacter johnsonii]UJA00999.1 hypothetical protein GBN93_08645 [Acinetobacter johnsonii]
MSTILIKDSLRQAVEAASGGLQTVLYTAKGQPTFMNIVKKFDMSSVIPELAGTHPAFIINGVEKSEIFIGTYSGTIRKGELLSLPNQAPVAANYVSYFNAAKANGAGHHMMTNAEWAALALKSWKDNTLPQGNGYYGRSSLDATQFGRRADGLDATQGITTGDPRILTGSGPVSFRHNGKYNGISDLAGNVKDMVQGVRVVLGELQITTNNDSASLESLAGESGMWRAIDARTGDLILPNGSGTTPYAVRFTTDLNNTDPYTLRFVGAALPNPQASTTFPVSDQALKILRKLAVLPPVEVGTAALLGVSVSTAENVMSRGGDFSSGNTANVFSLRLSDSRNALTTLLGSRPAYYTP